MDRWLVNQDNHQSSVDGLAELVKLARAGRLSAGDMVQPPGATDWLYASEIPEIADALPDTSGGAAGDDDLMPRRGPGALVGGSVAIAGVLGVVLLVGLAAMLYFFTQLPSGGERLVGAGGALSYSEMLVKMDRVPLRSEPTASATSSVSLSREDVVELRAKRGDFYRVATESGDEGWVAVDEVLPLYLLGGGEVVMEYDPLYNPDRYCSVRNASWLALDEEDANLTVFEFYLYNESEYAMTDLVIQATIKDARGNELERVEIPVEGRIPPEGTTMVGTLDPEGAEGMSDEERRRGKRLLTKQMFDELATADPDLMLRYKSGVEVPMRIADFTEASIDIIELRAIPESRPDPRERRRSGW